MSYAQKLACTILLVLAVAFSVGGSVLLYGNFDDMLSAAAHQNGAQHAILCYTLESNIIGQRRVGGVVDDLYLTQLAELLDTVTTQNEMCFALYSTAGQSASVNSSMPPNVHERALTLEDQQSVYVRENASVYAVYKTTLSDSVALASAFDVTQIFAARGRAMQRFLALEAVVLVCAALAAAWLSRWLTRPLLKLTAASRSIAGGAYTQRTRIAGHDEVAALSQSFDTMAEAVESRVHELEDSLRRRDDFMGALSHELKTPMTAIIGYADTLRVMQCEPEQQRAAAAYIYAEAGRVERLSQKLLQLLRLSEEPLVLADVSLKRPLAAIARAMRPLSGDVVLEVEPCSLTVRADEDLLTDLLYNLVHNAVKACEGQGIVRVMCHANEQRLTVTVSDTGKGIPPQELSHVLEPFYRVDKARARRDGGSGLGLALCSKIAQVHGTELVLDSDGAQGTRVSFTLCLAVPSAECAPDARGTDLQEEAMQ